MNALVLTLLLAVDAAEELRRANEFLRLRKLEEASVAVARALAADLGSVAALTLQGRVAMARGDTQLARQALGRVVEMLPGSANAHFMLGFCFYVDNDFVRALPALRSAHQFAPDDARTSLFLALTLDGLARPEEARVYYEQAVKRTSASVEAHVAFARFLFTAGDFGLAAKQVDRALGIDPNSREAHYELARLAFERGETSVSLKAAQRALGLAGDGVSDRQIHFLLSRAFARAGNTERAGFHRKQFEAIAPRMVR